MYPEFSFDVIMIPWPLGIVLHQETFFFFFPNCIMLKHTDNKPPGIRFSRRLDPGRQSQSTEFHPHLVVVYFLA